MTYSKRHLLSLVFAVAVLSGCGGGSGGFDSDQQERIIDEMGTEIDWNDLGTACKKAGRDGIEAAGRWYERIHSEVSPYDVMRALESVGC